MKTKQDIAFFLLRLTLAFGFLSAVASRFNLWGSKSSGWHNFVAYTSQTNSFLPNEIVPTLAIMATVAEVSLGILLLIGYKLKYVATTAAILTLLFAIAMTISFGIKEPLDYSVFTFSAACFLVSTSKKIIKP
jgi:putative oxidoreductase